MTLTDPTPKPEAKSRLEVLHERIIADMDSQFEPKYGFKEGFQVFESILQVSFSYGFKPLVEKIVDLGSKILPIESALRVQATTILALGFISKVIGIESEKKE